MPLLPKIMVLGVGNEILTDEGVGVHVIRALQRERLPENVAVITAGTAGIEMLPLIAGLDRLIVVDAMDASDEPGTIYKFAPDDINVLPPEYHVSVHQIGLVELLYLAAARNELPATVIFGIQPKVMDWGLVPTPEVAGKIPRIVELVKREIKIL